MNRPKLSVTEPVVQPAPVNPLLHIVNCMSWPAENRLPELSVPIVSDVAPCENPALQGALPELHAFPYLTTPAPVRTSLVAIPPPPRKETAGWLTQVVSDVSGRSKSLATV